jgi:hypothetical protein
MPGIQLEEDLKVADGLSTYPIWYTSLRNNGFWQTFLSLTQITLKPRKGTTRRALPTTTKVRMRTRYCLTT